MQERRYRRAVRIVAVTMSVTILFFLVLLVLFIVKPDTQFYISKETSRVALANPTSVTPTPMTLPDEKISPKAAKSEPQKVVEPAPTEVIVARSAVKTVSKQKETPTASQAAYSKTPDGKHDQVIHEDDRNALIIIDCSQDESCREE